MALGVVVVGMGPRGRDWVREVRASPVFELVACVDADQNVLQSASTSLEIPQRQCFIELTSALERNRGHAVIVATSANRHVHACEEALSRNLAVLVEKPFTLRLSEAVKLVSLAEARRVPLLVAQNYRYMRSFRGARQLIRDGVLGKVGMVVCQYYRPPHHMASAPDGFCIVKGRNSLYENGDLLAKDMHRLITALLGARAEAENLFPQTSQMSGVS